MGEGENKHLIKERVNCYTVNENPHGVDSLYFFDLDMDKALLTKERREAVLNKLIDYTCQTVGPVDYTIERNNKNNNVHIVFNVVLTSTNTHKLHYATQQCFKNDSELALVIDDSVGIRSIMCFKQKKVKSSLVASFEFTINKVKNVI